MSEKTGTEILMAQSPSIGEVIDRLNRRLAAAQERAKALEKRLEIVPGHPYDGIDCRDETIRLADERIREVEAERDALRKDAERYRQERDHERARRERVTQLLLAIHARLSSPAPIESDGRTYIFDPIDKTMYWEVHQQLCELIRKIPQELDAALDATKEPTR